MHYRLLFLTLIINTAEMVLLCDLEEATKSHTFSYTFNNNAQLFIWRKNGIKLFLCQDSNCIALLEAYKNIYEAARSHQDTTLKIKAVTTQSGGNYSCEIENTEFFNICLTVYAKPDMVTCQDPELQTKTNEITVVGTVLGVYPNPVCQFTWFFNNTESRSIHKSMVEYNNLNGSRKPDYFNQRCSVKVPARNFTRGKHQFQLLAYPNVTGQDNDTVYGKNSSQTSQTYVADPNVTLVCSETSVPEGKRFSCTCKDTANTFILPTTTLFYGGAQVSSALQQVTANVTARRQSLELICQAQLPDGTEANKTQTVQVYYGPSNVSLRVIYNQTENDVISLCDRPLTVTVNCSAPVTDVNPGVNYQFYSNVTDTPSALSKTPAANYTVTSGGLFYFLCTGNNSMFSSLSATSTHKTIQVTAPPSRPVIEKYQDEVTSFIVVGDQLTIKEGVVAWIRCRVEGGYPSVSVLQLECGSQTSTNKDNNVVYTDVNITRSMDGSNCSCTATHKSSCYRNNTAQIVLDVHFGPTINIVEANNNSGQVILEKNSSVSISCQADGNPSPNLSLRKDGTEIQSLNGSTHKFNLTLTYNKAISECMDTGVYMCHAETGQAVDDKTVTVYVKCAQQFRDHDSLSQIYKEQVNGAVLIYVPVFGYPEPTVTLNSNKYRLSSESYTLNYTKQEPPYGTVSLVINIENTSYFQNYSLNINNTEGELTYSFEIVAGDAVTHGPDDLSPTVVIVGAVAGGIFAAVLVIIIICVIVCLAKRKGTPCKRKGDQNAISSIHTLYENDDSGSRHALEVLPEAQDPDNTYYEELIDYRSDLPEKYVCYANQILADVRDEEAVYGNISDV